MSLPVLRRLLVLLPVVLACALAACRDNGWTKLDEDDLLERPLLRLPDDNIYTLASAPDGSVFVSTFGGHVYRRMPRAHAWTRVASVGPDPLGAPTLLTLHPFSARGFVGMHFSRIYRWREGEPLREEKTALSDSTTFCGDFHSRVTLHAAWGTEDDTYVVGDKGNVLHYRRGAWRLERNPLTDGQPDLCYRSFPVDLGAVGGADGWVYAAASHVIRSRGDGRWEEVPLPAGSAVITSIAHHEGALLFAVPRLSDESRAKARMQFRFYRPGRRAGDWAEAARSPWPVPILESGTAHPGGPAVFFGMVGGRIVVLEDGRARAWWHAVPGVRLRGAVPSGRDVLVALNAGETGIVVRLPR
jgi:hypothetical protein